MADLSLKEKLIKLKSTKAYRLEQEKYRYFEPIGKVEEFINLVGSGKYFIILLSAANGVGKTTAGANILAHLFWPCDNPYFQASLFQEWPFPKQGRIVSDPTTITDTLIPILKDQFPKGRFGVDKYNTTKAGKRYEYQWRTDTGWDFNIMTYEQALSEFEAATLGFAWFDEPPPAAIFKATVARMRKGGIIFITATPLTGSAWMYDEIIASPEREAKFRAFVEADVEDACKTHGIRGFLDHDLILKMIAQYDEEDMKARAFGKFQHLVGLIYKKFSRKIHVIAPFAIKKEDYVVVEALDPHPRTPDAVMWLAVDRKGTKFIVDELSGKFTTGELAGRIKDKAQNYRIVKRIADRMAFTEDQHTGESLASRLLKLGLQYQPASKRRAQAIRRTGDALDYEIRGNELIRAPELYVFDICTRTIWEFEHWKWEDWRGKTAEYKDPREKPEDKDDHMMENLGRILLENAQFTEMRKETYIHKPVVLDPFD